MKTTKFQRRAWRKAMNITTMTATTELYRSTEHRKWNYLRNGFLTFSTFSGNPYENGFLYTFTFEPSSSQRLQKTSPFHSALLSLSLSLLLYISQFVVVNFLGHCDFLGLCSCRSFGFRLISIPLCYTQFRNIWKLHIVKNLILWKGMTTQPGFEHSYFSSATISDFAPRA